MIKDVTRVWQTQQITVELDDSAPMVKGLDALTLDAIEFRPVSVEIMWMRKDAEPWELYKVEIDNVSGLLTRVILGRDLPKLADLAWVRSIADEVGPKNS